MTISQRYTSFGSAMSSPHALKPSSDEELRSKFLNMIGIESKLPPQQTSEDGKRPGLKQFHTETWVDPRAHKVLMTEKLKYDPYEDKRYSRRASPLTKRRKVEKKKRKQINFNETVYVVPIPMRSEYSNRVRTRLWSNAIELHRNAARNTIEFAHEGYVVSVDEFEA
jgi:hypothetical protein